MVLRWRWMFFVYPMTRYCECADCLQLVPFESEEAPRTYCAGCALAGCAFLMSRPDEYRCMRMSDTAPSEPSNDKQQLKLFG